MAGARLLAVVVTVASVASACSPAEESAAPSPLRSVSPAGPLSLEELARVSAGGEPIGIVEGFGSIWVVNSEFEKRRNTQRLEDRPGD